MKEKNKYIPFTKMQGAGNDFVVLDNRSLEIPKEQIVELAPDICNRKLGVGSDGIMALLPPERNEVDYTMFYRNPDGSDAGMCGNGARCIALFAHYLGFDTKQTFSVHSQIYSAHVEDSNRVRVDFPMEAKIKKLSIDDHDFWAVHTGTEHIVTTVKKDRLKKEDFLKERGRHLRYHPSFKPKGTNVNFIHGKNDSTVELQTYERGVEDLTLACGTGAIASALVWNHLKKNDSSTQKISVLTKGGALNVYFSFEEKSQTYSKIQLEGPAHFVFKGKFMY